MTWEKIDFETAQRDFSIKDYDKEMYPNTQPYLVWGKKPSPETDDPCEAMRIYVHRGNLTVDSIQFDTNHFIEPEADMLIVDGDLVITGDLDVEQFDVGTPGYLCVRGNMTARNIFVTSQFELLVWGNLNVKEILFAAEFAMGQVRCNGDLTAGITIIDDYLVSVHGQINAPMYVIDRKDEPDYFMEKITAGGFQQEAVRARIDESGDLYWMLVLPDHIHPEDFDSAEDLQPYAVLTPEAAVEYEAGALFPSVKDLLRRHGLAAFKLKRDI